MSGAGSGPRGRSRAARRRPLLPGSGPLAGVPAPLAFGVVVLLFAAGVIVGGLLGAVLLAVLALGIAGLLAATWPQLTPPERLGRVLVLVVLVAVTVGVALR